MSPTPRVLLGNPACARVAGVRLHRLPKVPLQRTATPVDDAQRDAR